MEYALPLRLEGQVARAPDAVDSDSGSDVWPQHIDYRSPRTWTVANGNLCEDALGPRPFENGAIILQQPLNDVARLNDVLRALHARLSVGGYVAVQLHTRGHQRRAYSLRHSRLMFDLYYGWEFLVHRVLARLAPTRRLYSWLFGTQQRFLTETEALGRLAYCGFELTAQREIGGALHILGRKQDGEPRPGDPPYGLLFSMERYGEGGRMIRVHKMRTMHPYAEYIQKHVHAANRLSARGKPKNDFRVTTWGRWFRKLWIDELPMVINWARGELKLVGVRPITRQYAALLPPEFLQYRLRFKPGLVPPFYADLPRTFEEIIDSEMRYLRSYEKAPVRTDLRYLWQSVRNILIRGARSE